MSSIGTTPSTANQNHPVSTVHEQIFLASNLSTSNATTNSNQTASAIASTSYMSLNVERFPSLEEFYSAIRNA